MLQFPQFNDLYCNYSFVFGQDWTIVSVRPTPVDGLMSGLIENTSHGCIYLQLLTRCGSMLRQCVPVPLPSRCDRGTPCVGV